MLRGMKVFGFGLIGLAFCFGVHSRVCAGPTKIFGGDLAGNGGGLVEQNFQFAHINLPWIVRGCLFSARCVSGEETRVLNKIFESLPAELKAKSALIFESGAANPVRYIRRGMPRVAVTGDHVGDPIYLNLDLLYGISPSGKTEAADVGTAIGILIHELAHHQGNYQGQEDEQFLDLLGARVRAYAATEIEVFKTDFWGEIPEQTRARIEILALHSNVTALDSFYDGPQSSLLLSDSHQSFSLDSDINSQLQCPGKSGHSGKVLGYRFHGMRWDKWRYANRSDFRRIYSFHAPVFLQCLYPNEDLTGTFYTNLEVVLTLAFDEPKSGSANSTYQYVEHSLKLTLIPQ